VVRAEEPPYFPYSNKFKFKTDKFKTVSQVSLFNQYVDHSTAAMAKPRNQEHQNHEMECYLAVQSRMEDIGGWGGNSIPVKTKTALSSKLNRLSNSPAISFNATRTRSTLIANLSLTVGGEDAGSRTSRKSWKRASLRHSEKGTRLSWIWNIAMGERL
jgi:hypothetical protein